MHEESSLAPISSESKHFFDLNIGMWLKEDLRKVKMNVIYVKKFKTKIDIWSHSPVLLDLFHIPQEYFYVHLQISILVKKIFLT